MIRRLSILLLTVSLIFFVGCKKDFLQLTPTDSISAESALSSPENMMLILNGLHRQMYCQNPLPGAEWSRTGQSHFMPMYDAISGIIIHTSPGNGWHKSDLQWLDHTNATYTTPRNLWYQRYHFIASCNAIINKVEDAGMVIDANMKNILGQAYAYRAWAYHVLVSSFAKGYLVSSDPSSQPGVPLLFATTSPYTSEPRSSVQAIYNQIEDDIDQAIAYLSDGASTPANKSHISLNAAYGIKARIALSKGDWATAATNAVLARDGYPLMDESDYKSGFNTYDLSEVIWGGHVINEETNYYASFFYYVGTNFNGSQNRANPKMINNAVWEAIPETDYRKDLWLPKAPNTYSAASNGEGGSWESDPNYDNAADWEAAKVAVRTEYGMTSAFNLHPYMSVKFLNKNPSTIDPDDVIYMRSSEMYLIEAEAYAMQGFITQSQDALDILASERDPDFDKTQFSTQEEIMAQIKFQWEVELWGEGFGYFNKIRWNDPIDHTNSGASLVLYNDGFQQNKPSVNDNWIFKIPQMEIDANPNLGPEDQN